MIRASNRFYRRFCCDHTWSEDLDWSGTLIFNSSETSLRYQVTERLTTLPADKKGGPLFFKLMMGIVTSTLSEAIETLVDNLRKLTLKADAFLGKDIDGLNKMIRGGHSRLLSCNSVLKDMYELICRAYQTSSVPEFNNMFELYLNLHKRPVEPGESARVGDITALLQSGETEYRSLHGRGVWTVLLKSCKLKQAGGFYGGNDEIVVCYRCRKEGLTSRDCMEHFPFAKEGSTDT
jgi:hypothetical protein